MELKSSCGLMVKNRTCSYYNGVTTTMINTVSNNVMDIEDMAEFGKKHKVCPYYLYRDPVMLAKADFVLMPYNFLTDPSVRRGIGELPWANSIVIVDEAHNLEKICDEVSE
jgi:regulator of telomere elongation helicase 1